jgi:hypothetical protein
MSMRIRIQEFNGQKFDNFTAEKGMLFDIKNCNAFTNRPPEGRPSNRRSLRPLKENIQHFKKKFHRFLKFLAGSGSSRPKSNRIRIHNSDLNNILYKVEVREAVVRIHISS